MSKSDKHDHRNPMPVFQYNCMDGKTGIPGSGFRVSDLGSQFGE
jgi:hypothetical protein